ncbi:MAG: hypothetical protein P9M15_00335 [Candidatus Electryoneaceae bacterium]|nr:hypothetical protein [Candidatus Electryoneaceae bacterium]
MIRFNQPLIVMFNIILLVSLDASGLHPTKYKRKLGRTILSLRGMLHPVFARNVVTKQSPRMIQWDCSSVFHASQ